MQFKQFFLTKILCINIGSVMKNIPEINYGKVNLAEVRKILGKEPPKVITSPKSKSLNPNIDGNEKLLASLTAIGVAALGSVFALKTKNLDVISKAQKTFSEAFMRDISRGEAAVMIDRYKEISKIEDKSEYIQTLFNEVKNNYGFCQGTLRLKSFTDTKRPCQGGFVNKLIPDININTDLSKEELFDVMHHEFRHKLQEFMMLNETEGLTGFIPNMNEHLKDISPQKAEGLAQWLKGNYPDYMKQFGVESFYKDRVPVNEKQWVNKCIEATPKYEEWQKNKTETYQIGQDNDNGYYYNFLETDARKIGSEFKRLYKQFI